MTYAAAMLERLRADLAWCRRALDAGQVLESTSASGGTPRRVGEALELLDAEAERMAAAEDERMASALELADPKLRAAVGERLAQTWPWSPVVWLTLTERDHFLAASQGPLGEAFALFGTLRRAALAAERPDLTTRTLLEAATPTASDVAPLDVLRWVRDGLNRIKRGDGERHYQRAEAWASAAGLPLGPTLLDIGDSTIAPQQLSWAFSAVQAVEADRRRPAFKAPSNRHAHSLVRMMLEPPSHRNWGRWKAIDHAMVLKWDGKATPYQLVLIPGEGEDISAQIARSIHGELGTDGLRDWMILQRLASCAGGKNGEMVWTWAEHREGTLYRKRVENGKDKDDELAREVRGRLMRLKRAELVSVFKNKEGEELRHRIGPWGLIDVDAEAIAADGAPIAISIRINPELYGATKGTRGAGYTLVSNSVLELPDRPFRLYTAIAYALRRANGTHAFKAKTLWEYAGIELRQQQARRRWPECQKTLENALESLKKSEGVEWTGGGPLPTDLYTVTAPRWWTDRLVHGVGPILPGASTAGAPRTGAELAAMRRERGLSQQAVAEQLKAVAPKLRATQGTLSRLERKGELPADVIQALADARLHRAKPTR